MRRPHIRAWFVLAVPLGVALGLGLFTFGYAEGLSYLSNDPRACTNCHIMNEQFDGWVKGPHHHVANCNDCHVPQNFVGKYMAKASNGYHHSKGFTLENFHEPIMIKPGNLAVVQENCLRCHGDFVHELTAGSTTAEDAVSCVHCHKGVGHGSRR